MKKIIIFSVALVLFVIGLIFLKNYLHPNIEASLHKYNWMDHIQVLRTDWYGSDGITFFVEESDNNNEFCKGFVNKGIFRTKVQLVNCVLVKKITNEGVYGSTRFHGKTLLSGFTGAHTKVNLKSLKVKTITYQYLKAWYAFNDKNTRVEPTFKFESNN